MPPGLDNLKHIVVLMMEKSPMALWALGRRQLSKLQLGPERRR